MDRATLTPPLAAARIARPMPYDAPTRLIEWLTDRTAEWLRGMSATVDKPRADGSVPDSAGAPSS